MSKKIVVLISGSGSNLQAIIDAISAKRIDGTISAVISNRPDVFGLERAEKAAINTQVLDHKAFASREAFDAELMSLIDQHQPDLVVLAGFMRILTAEFVRHYQGRMLNIHPSLLPKYKGLDTHQRAIDAGEEEHGCTVHFVTEELDGGPAAIQGTVSIDSNDSADSLQQKVHKVEHQIYPYAVELFCADRLKWTEQAVLLDNEPLSESGFRYQK